jgi:hypothetical protein
MLSLGFQIAAPSPAQIVKAVSIFFRGIRQRRGTGQEDVLHTEPNRVTSEELDLHPIRMCCNAFRVWSG